MASESTDISVEFSRNQDRRVNIYGSFVAAEELIESDVEVEAAEAEMKIDAHFSSNSLRKSFSFLLTFALELFK